MSEKEKNEKPRIKYEKPEAQRLVETKAHGACSPGSGDSGSCEDGNNPNIICGIGNVGFQ